MKIKKIGLILVVLCLVSTSLTFASSPYIDVTSNCSITRVIPYATKVKFAAESKSTPASDTKTLFSAFTTYKNEAIIEHELYQDDDLNIRTYSDTYTAEKYDTLKIESSACGLDYNKNMEKDSDEDEYFVTGQ